ncbi:MAG: hypothetical protein GWM92_07735 [Gemmatimonadetes bacterium]|nr:hypothetical protein [Gemmatimonadota bacterium]NIR78513.1 hypothetical protein [Gemmatimonadota bacterium]NIT87129.1 hypothetical protein [Gemmatimonadota bacterium]NIU30966.1 hypothetical protein [Gemmatimonadota bacterium]NIU35727.1 hypothetical protein [Gemmatimonadota bacterium]
MAVVLLLLFAIGVAGATSYEIVRSEATLSQSRKVGTQALGAARAGLVRFMAEEDDTLPVERTYTVDGARAVVTPRLVVEHRFPNRRYAITSVGSFLDPRFSEELAERTVIEYAMHWRSPIHALGVIVAATNSFTSDDISQFSGYDIATAADCPEAPADPIAGLVGGGSMSITDDRYDDVEGVPRSVSYGSPQAVLDSLGMDWDVFLDPDFEVDYEDTWPDFSLIHPDTFPVIRMTGNFDAQYYHTGRGLLIVGEDLYLRSGFTWDGIILANDMTNVTTNENFLIRGLLAVGMDGVGEPVTYRGEGEAYFHSCNVLAAGRKIAQLEPMAGTWWEVF